LSLDRDAIDVLLILGTTEPGQLIVARNTERRRGHECIAWRRGEPTRRLPISMQLANNLVAEGAAWAAEGSPGS
jgi:hypothetical protein